MPEFSLVVRNARIVDGTGGPATFGDVAVNGDRISAVGTVCGRGENEIDAAGLVLAPGFIDVHTHYDPQLCWDRLATPTPEHGVTSLIMGNCSVSLAPVRPEARDTLIRWFGSVEDMEGELLRKNVSFKWESVGEYLNDLRSGTGPNVGAFVGHAVLRAYVMGAAAQERAATVTEIEHMVKLLRRSLAAGGFGLSFTFNHLDDRGNELPCMYARRDELLALLREVAAANRMVEVAPNFRDGHDPTEQFDLFGAMSLETGATVTLSPILHLASRGDEWRRMLDRLEFWRKEGASIFAQTQVRPLDINVILAQGSLMFSKTQLWRSTMDQPIGDRKRMLADPALRDRYFDETQTIAPLVSRLLVKRSASPENACYVGRDVGEISIAEKRRLSDVFLDIALADGLETEFTLSGQIHADTEVVLQLLQHPGIHIGSADAGAHITSFSGAGDTCYLFDKFVRTEKKLTVEGAVRMLTHDLARDWKIADRGVIAAGKFADLVVFDPETIARGAEEWVQDLPGGGGRYVHKAHGISRVIVNGVTVVAGGQYTGATPGHVI